jgi:hypothetical protein
MDFYLVDLAEISCEVPRSNFEAATIERLADAILASGGAIRPLVLDRAGIDRYLVLHGHLEYYGAVRAREKNPRAAEMVNAFVIEQSMRSAVDLQLELLNPPSIDLPTASPNDDNKIDRNFANLEARFNLQFDRLHTSFQQQIDKLSSQIASLTTAPAPAQPTLPVLQLLNSRSELELLTELKRSRINGAEKLAAKIVIARDRQPDRQFSDYDNFVDSVSGLGSKTFNKILAAWGNV